MGQLDNERVSLAYGINHNIAKTTPEAANIAPTSQRIIRVSEKLILVLGSLG